MNRAASQIAALFYLNVNNLKSEFLNRQVPEGQNTFGC